YSDPSIFRPLINASQELCAKPIDLTPPASPTLDITAECPTGFVKVSWTDVGTIHGSDDVYKYELYYKPTVNDTYRKVGTVLQGQALSYTYDDTSSISGCYAVRAVDKKGNESVLSQDFCIDNCPEFELPNIFSPNGDNANDFFQAIKVRQIKEIDLAVVDRWGHVVYTSNDPYFKWNGVSVISNAQVSEGTFFYVCKVFEPRLKGVTTKILKGTVQVVR
ncbi:MAG: gliding motility-associated C-terminal domain-containing protein, partial [Bacteroidia bacterium]|nr:gliding motility-associated C-terminal domain-containing protein [Bacteroidia bacterium]